MVESTGCSCRVPRFYFQNSHGHSQPSLTSVLGSNVLFWLLQALHEYGAQTSMQAKHSYAIIMIIIILFSVRQSYGIMVAKKTPF